MGKYNVFVILNKELWSIDRGGFLSAEDPYMFIRTKLCGLLVKMLSDLLVTMVSEGQMP